jgi:single-stranded-DNA-specific exonuclease
VNPINYKLLYEGDIFSTDLRERIAINRNLPPDWCQRLFTQRPSFDFSGLDFACETFQIHLGLQRQKFQIVVDSDLDGICSASIVYKFLQKFYPELECVYSLHTGKQHGLSPDIKVDSDTTLVITPDAGVNDINQCKELSKKGIDVLCCDHHIIEQQNPYADIVSCMDGEYPNQHLCGAAVTWLFLYGFCQKYIQFPDEYHSFLLSLLDLVAIATISDIMEVTNEDNMYFIQNGLSNIQSKALRAFLISAEANLNGVTVEDIKFKVSPLVSAMIRMGSMEEKTLLFRAFIDDYEEFDYEKRGSLNVETENIYDRVVRLCKNAKSRQDRAKQKLLDSCQVHEYEHILLVEYQDSKPSTLTGLVANELANQYCKPCFVYRTNVERDKNGEAWFSGSIRNYDGSPIESIKDLLSCVFQKDGFFQGHDNAMGGSVLSPAPNDNAGFFADLIEGYIHKNIVFADGLQNTAIGEKVYNVDFEIDADDVDAGFVSRMTFFDHYSGYGFAPVTALIHGIHVDAENFKTMGKNSLSWKICGDGVDYVKFKIQEDDPLLKEMDDIDFEFTTDKVAYIDAICTFGINVYKGVAYPQAVVKDYTLTTYNINNPSDDDDWDLDLEI